MTKPSQDPGESPTPIWVTEQPFDQQLARGSAPSPVRRSAVPPVVSPVRARWPWVALGSVGVITVAVAVAIAASFSTRQDQDAKGFDESLKADLLKMATRQHGYVKDHPGELGFPVPPTSPGGKVPHNTDPHQDFNASEGNVIAVVVGPGGYCVSGYNARASRATSPTASMTYSAVTKVVQTAPGICALPAPFQRMARADEGLMGDLLKMATRQDAYIAGHPAELGFAVAPNGPGGTRTSAGPGFTLAPGNVLAVAVGPDGYCVSGYNPLASRATSPTASMTYRAGFRVVQRTPGFCVPVVLQSRVTGVDELLRADVVKVATIVRSHLADRPGRGGFGMDFSEPGGTVSTPTGAGRVTLSPGTVIGVESGPDGYCVLGYNARASRATSPTATMTYRAFSNVVQTAPSTC